MKDADTKYRVFVKKEKKESNKQQWNDYYKAIASTIIETNDTIIQDNINIKDVLGNNSLHIIVLRIANSSDITETSNMLTNAATLLNIKEGLRLEQNNAGFIPAELLIYSLELEENKAHNAEIESAIFELYKSITTSNHQQQIENVIKEIEGISGLLEYLQKLSSSYNELAQYIASEIGISLTIETLKTSEKEASSELVPSINNAQTSNMSAQNANIPNSSITPYAYFMVPLQLGGTTTVQATITASQHSSNIVTSTVITQAAQNLQREFQLALPKLPAITQQNLAISFIENSNLTKQDLDAAFEQGSKKRDKRKLEIEQGSSVAKVARSASNEVENAADLSVKGIRLSQESKHQEALECHLKALKLRESNPQAPMFEMAQSYELVGNSYGMLAQYVDALKSHEQALTLYTRILPEYHVNIVCALNNIGLDYNGLGDHNQALEKHMMALDITQKLSTKNSKDLLPQLSRVIDTYQKMANHDRTLHYQLEALEILRINKPKLDLETAGMLFNIGITYLELNDRNEGTEHIDEAKGIYINLQDNNNAKVCQNKIDEVNQAHTWRDRISNSKGQVSTLSKET